MSTLATVAISASPAPTTSNLFHPDPNDLRALSRISNPEMLVATSNPPESTGTERVECGIKCQNMQLVPNLALGAEWYTLCLCRSTSPSPTAEPSVPTCPKSHWPSCPPDHSTLSPSTTSRHFPAP